MNIFEYTAYRIYLKAWLERAKHEKTFNLSRLAEVANVHVTFLSQVILGAKHLSLEQAARLSLHFGHTRLERDYFFVLVHLDRAGTQVLKEYWLEKKTEIEGQKNKLSERFHKHHELTDQQRAIFYSSWLYVAIWACTSIDDGQSLNQVAERFGISRAKAEEILVFLVAAGICTEKRGKFRVGKAHVHVTNESPFVVKHHVNWRLKAMQMMDQRQEPELFFTGPMSLNKKDFASIREKLNILIKDVVSVVKETSPEELFCLNIDFFRADPQ